MSEIWDQDRISKYHMIELLKMCNPARTYLITPIDAQHYCIYVEGIDYISKNYYKAGQLHSLDGFAAYERYGNMETRGYFIEDTRFHAESDWRMACLRYHMCASKLGKEIF